MIFIAESGSTKCDAVFVKEDGTEIARINTMGFNPFFHTAAFIQRELSTVAEINTYGPQVSQVFFYGAGCSSPALNSIVAKGLEKAFPNASILVDHDLKSCAYATYRGEPAISCILGTGSNSVYYDGNSISEEVPALAYILGDEGSASYLGKKLLAAYLYKQLPAAIHQDFDATYGLRKDEILDQVYTKPHANVFLASFAPFFSKHIEHPFIWEIVFSGFRNFLQTHALCYPNAREVKLNFVGSIAHYFQDVLEDAVNHLDLQMGVVVQKPLDGLIQYHLEYIIGKPVKTIS
jgi:N-acetylglucosamine kinase-like BadF-type ATPase